LPGSSGDGGAASGTSGNLTLNTLSREASAHLFGTGKSLTWDEFQNPEDDGLLSAENSPSKAAVAAAATALDVSLFQTETTSTAAAATLRDMLDKANLNWDNYLGSPIGMTSSSLIDSLKAIAAMKYEVPCPPPRPSQLR
jgi:hypothetical protein